VSTLRKLFETVYGGRFTNWLLRSFQSVYAGFCSAWQVLKQNWLEAAIVLYVLISIWFAFDTIR
jgi:hypothetical protein